MKKSENIFLTVFLFLFLIAPNNTQAQKHSTISIHSESYYIFNYPSYFIKNYYPELSRFKNQLHAHWPVYIMGIKYQYHFSKSLSAFANYSFTTNQSYFSIWGNRRRFMFMSLFSNGFYTMPVDYYDPNGVLVGRHNYHFFDLGGSYRYWINQKHKVSLNFGISYAHGYNWYLTRARYEADVIYTQGEGRWEGYWGGLVGLNYDYYFWKGRINAGVEVDLRYYTGTMPSFVNYGLHVGYNF